MSTETEQIAICDEQIDSEEKISFMTNKIGGVPKYLPEKYFDLKTCSRCNKKMILVCQLYCPLENSVYHRVFYVMACAEQSCWNQKDAWCVYRCQLPDYEFMEEQKRLKASLSVKTKLKIVDDWGCDNSDWDEDPAEDKKQKNEGYVDMVTHEIGAAACAIDPLQQDLDSAIETMQNINLSANASSRDMFNDWRNNNIIEKGAAVPFYLNVVNRYLFLQSSKMHRKANSEEMDDEEIQFFRDDKPYEDKACTKHEEYEKTSLKHGDKIFYKFRKSIDFCPYQSLRYCRESKPLFVAANNDFDLHVRKCSYCGAALIFEFQLMPALVNFLKPAEPENHKTRNLIEFGTVIVYTCLNSCWSDSDGFRIEAIYFQSDPDAKVISDFEVKF